jgi:hypothetical protein
VHSDVTVTKVNKEQKSKKKGGCLRKIAAIGVFLLGKCPSFCCQ